MLRFALIVVLVANFASILGCYWLLGHLRKLDACTQQRLFIRQIRGLATVDIFFHSVFIVMVPFLETIGGGWGALYNFSIVFNADFGAVLCPSIMITFHSLEYSSILLELHLSMTFVCQALHAQGPVLLLIRVIRLVYVLGFVLSVSQYMFTPFKFDLKNKTCFPTGTEWFSVSLLVGTFFFATIAYAMAVARACRQEGKSFVSHNWRRAAAYPLTFICTYLGIIAATFHPILWSRTWFCVTANLLHSLNGLGNVVVYFLQSRYARRQKPFAVAHHGTPHRIQDTVTFRVDFGGVDVLDVTDINMSARLQAEAETDALEAQNCHSASTPCVNHSPVRDEVGSDRYGMGHKIIRSTCVQEEPDLLSAEIATLGIGQRVQVCQVFCNREEQVFWGRIYHPAGWIILRTMLDACDFAIPDA